MVRSLWLDAIPSSSGKATASLNAAASAGNRSGSIVTARVIAIDPTAGMVRVRIPHTAAEGEGLEQVGPAAGTYELDAVVIVLMDGSGRILQIMEPPTVKGDGTGVGATAGKMLLAQGQLKDAEKKLADSAERVKAELEKFSKAPIGTSRLTNDGTPIPGPMIADGAIGVEKLVVTKEMVATIGQYLEVTTQMLTAGNATIAGEAVVGDLIGNTLMGGMIAMPELADGEIAWKRVGLNTTAAAHFRAFKRTPTTADPTPYADVTTEYITDGSYTKPRFTFNKALVKTAADKTYPQIDYTESIREWGITPGTEQLLRVTATIENTKWTHVEEGAQAWIWDADAQRSIKAQAFATEVDSTTTRLVHVFTIPKESTFPYENVLWKHQMYLDWSVIPKGARITIDSIETAPITANGGGLYIERNANGLPTVRFQSKSVQTVMTPKEIGVAANGAPMRHQSWVTFVDRPYGLLHYQQVVQLSSGIWHTMPVSNATGDLGGGVIKSGGGLSVPVGGLYNVTGMIGFGASTSTPRGVAYKIGGEWGSASTVISAAHNRASWITFSDVVRLKAHDVVTLWGLQETGANLGTNACSLAISLISAL